MDPNQSSEALDKLRLINRYRCVTNTELSHGMLDKFGLFVTFVRIHDCETVHVRAQQILRDTNERVRINPAA